MRVESPNRSPSWRSTPLRRRLRQALLLTRLAANRAVGRWLPEGGATRRQGLCREWEFLRCLDQLEIRNPFESGILSSLTQDDEYGVMHCQLQPHDHVVDVGAHIGGFSYLCHRHGSRSIHAFEPDPGNFDLLLRNLGKFPGAHLHRRAVFRSDVPTRGQHLDLSAYEGLNTGAVSVIWSGAVGGLEAGVETVALDEVLSGLDRVRLLKLDCEGSEFPILLTSRELHRVEEIVGEYHEVHPADMVRLTPAARVPGVTSYERGLLVETLERAGFVVTLRSVADRLGLFRAVRP